MLSAPSLHSSRPTHPTTEAARQTASDFMHNNYLVSDSQLSQSPSSSLITPPTMPFGSMTAVIPDASIPTVPLEAIYTLQQASADMLSALVRKGAVDREKQLLVAVGTLRTCLDVFFVPHMETWQADAVVVGRITAAADSVEGDASRRAPTQATGPPRKPRNVLQEYMLTRQPEHLLVRGIQMGRPRLELIQHETPYDDKSQ